MNKIKQLALLTIFNAVFVVNAADAAAHKIGILVFDGFLTSDVTAPVEVFGAATKKSWFSSYEVVVISATTTEQPPAKAGGFILRTKVRIRVARPV